MTDDATRDIRATFDAHGITPTDEELIAYSFLSQMLRALADQLYVLDIPDER